jgi:hypothetical protein
MNDDNARCDLTIKAYIYALRGYDLSVTTA